MPKISLELPNFNNILKRLEQLDGNSKKVAETALKKTHDIVTTKAKAAIYVRRDTGLTEESLREEAKVEWNGNVATVKVGFDIGNGGLASIFLMYGTPRMQKDKRLYDAFHGARVKKEIIEAQEKTYFEEIRRLDA